MTDRSFRGVWMTGLATAGLVMLATGCQKSKESTPDQAASAKADVYVIDVPLGLPPVPVPDDNPMTAAKVELGKLLYFDPRLSKSGTISCATCHDPKMAWAEHLPTSKGHKGLLGERNANTVINAAYLEVQFWDGRAATLEEQAAGPIENPAEMAFTMVDAIATIARIPDYQKRFQEVFNESANEANIVKAIAAFERTILSGNAPYDRYKADQKGALTDTQKRGLDVFMDKGQCATCHTPPIFTNNRYYNAGIGMDKEKPDEGRKKVTGQDRDLGRFRVPPLREVAKTHPYFHDGSVETLREATAIMARGGINNPNLSSMLKGVREENLTNQDIDDLVAFMDALSGQYPIIEPPLLP